MDNSRIVLYIGCDSEDATRIRQTLERAALGFQVVSVASPHALEEHLRDRPCACVMSETDLLDLDPQRLLRIVAAENPDIPVVFLIELADEALACEVTAWGASGYVLKTPRYLRRLPHEIARVCERQQLQTSHKRAVRELRQLIDSANAPIFGVDTQGRITVWNLAAAKITGYPGDDVLGKSLIDNFIAAEHRDAVKHVLDLALDEIETANFELPLLTKSGEAVLILLNASTRRNDADEITGVVGVGQDLTERRRAEEALSWESGVNAALAELSRAVISASSMADIADLIVEHARCFTRSQCASVTPDGGASANGAPLNKGALSPLNKGALSPLNKGALSPLNKGAPLAEAPCARDAVSGQEISKHRITVPVMVGDRQFGQISVANADDGYTGRDRMLLERLANVYALTLERHHREQELRQLSIAVDQSAAVIVITDLEGRILFVNKAFETSTGYLRAEVIGQNPRVLKATFLPPAVYQQLWATIAHGGVWQGEFLNQRKDGSTYWEEAIITPIKNARGEITQYIAVKEDVTQRKVVEEALKKAKEEAESANRLKNEFLANISHEIRTPMNAILGFADLLGEDEPDPAKQKQLQIIRESGQQLLTIIDDVLDFAKLESGAVEVQASLFAFREMLTALHQRYLPSAQQQHLDFTLKIADNVPRLAHGDEVRILQLLGNVVHNAVKFTRKGFVTLQCAYAQQRACFAITDSGIGIPEDKLERILMPFEQVDTSATRHHGGAGLGLAITQKLVRLMGGTLLVQSVFGQGTTVTIELPLPAEAAS